MAIPAEIRNIERPKNTVIHAYGKNKDRYSVIERVGCKRKNGKPTPVDGKTVGHIIDGKFVPLKENKIETVSMSEVDIKRWADIILCDSLTEEIREELSKFYNPNDVNKILCMAILRVCDPGIKDYELDDAFKSSFLSELYPDVHLGKNTVSKFQNDLGRTYSKIQEFMRLRTSTIQKSDCVLIDGTLKTNDSTENTFSEYSRKAKLKGRKDISIVYTFDLDKGEPICSQCFPGNMLDIRAYDRFVEDNKIENGILIGDKAFSSNQIEAILKEHPDLHYLNPLKRNSKLAKTHEMYTGMRALPGHNGILYKKEKINGVNKWLYSFRDLYLACEEEKDWVLRAEKDDTYKAENHEKKKEVFGTILLESDLDMEPKMAYEVRDWRWNIEVVMRYYKHSLEFDDTRVHDNESVIGCEFIDFISTIVTFKLLHTFNVKGLMEKKTYKEIMRILKHAQKIRTTNDDEWKLQRMNKNQLPILEGLGLIPKSDDPAPKKRGRPRKSQSASYRGIDWESSSQG